MPTEYVGARPTPYLTALADGVPDDVAIAWTGEAVVNDEVTAEEATARAGALGGRAPVLWDNHPVNDAVLGDRLLLGPLRGRDPALVDACDGYLANALVQPLVGLLPLAATRPAVRIDADGAGVATPPSDDAVLAAAFALMGR